MEIAMHTPGVGFSWSIAFRLNGAQFLYPIRHKKDHRIYFAANILQVIM